MEAFGDLLLYLAVCFAAGGVMGVAGAAVLLIARKSEPETQGPLRRIGWPMLGCGGCLVLVPVLLLAGILLFGLGVVAFCGDRPGC